eukprot:scaffold230293_cov14-Prasinocladus_malaysianus.AAC.1
MQASPRLVGHIFRNTGARSSERNAVMEPVVVGGRTGYSYERKLLTRTSEEYEDGFVTFRQ